MQYIRLQFIATFTARKNCLKRLCLPQSPVPISCQPIIQYHVFLKRLLQDGITAYGL